MGRRGGGGGGGEGAGGAAGGGAWPLETGLSPHTHVGTAARVFSALRIQKLPRLLVVSSSGHLYVYNLDPQDGGDCVLIKTHR